jgi:hypothetical protein
MALYDKKGQPLKFENYTDAENAIRSGQAFFKKGDKITLVDEDYNPLSVSGSDVNKYLGLGYTLNPIAIVAAKDAEKPENQGLLSSLKQFGKSFVSEAMFGIPEVVEQSQETELERAKREALEKQHSTASTLGSIGGFGTSLLYGGELTGATKLSKIVGKGAEGVATKLLGNATEQGLAKKALARAIEGGAKIGTESMAWTAPRAIAEASLGDPETAAEHLATAGLVGTVLGVTFAPIAPSIKNIFAEKAKLAKSGELIEPNKAALEALGLTPKEIYKMKDVPKEHIDAIMRKHNIGTVLDRKGALDDLVTAQKNVGKELEGLITQVDDELNKAVGTDTFKRSKLLYIDDLLDDIETRYVSPYKTGGVIDVGFESSAGKIEKQINSFKTKSFKSVKELNDFRKQVDNLIDVFESENPLSKKSMYRTALKDLRTDINEIIRTKIPNEIEAITGNTGLSNALKDAALEYHTLATVTPLVDKAVARGLNKRAITWGDLIHSIAGANVGDTVGGVLGLAYSKGVKLAPQAKYMVADVVNGIGKKMVEIPTAINNMLNGRAVKAVANIVPSVIAKETRNKDDMTDEIKKSLYLDVQDPTQLINIMSAKLEPLKDEIDEAQRVAVSNQVIKTVEYLRAMSPKEPQKNPLDNSKWRPSDTEIAKFNRRAEIAINPYKILDYIKTGTVTQEQVDAVSTLYPQLMGKIRTELSNQIAERNAKGKTLSYTSKINASKVLGFPIDRGMANVAILQSNFKKPEQETGTNIPRASKLKTNNTLSEQDALAFRKLKP